MAAIQYRLSRDIFQPSDEKLLSAVHVTKANKKKKNSFLCIAASNEPPVTITVYQIKKSDKDVYKKRQSWNLRELKQVDGKDCSKDATEFDLLFDRAYKWVASSPQDRNVFISCLWKHCSRLTPKPEFIHFPKELLEDFLVRTADVASKVVSDDVIEPEDYQALTEREESDLETLMSRCESAIGNAEAFTEQLSKDLSILDGENIHSIMASEDQVRNLMTMIQKAIDEATDIEMRLDDYDGILKNIRETMEKIEDKNFLIQMQNTNCLKLYEELEGLVNELDLPHSYQVSLLDGDLTNADNIAECTEAARSLLQAMNVKLQPSLLKMAAVQEQQRLFEKLRVRFSQRLSRHLNNLFIHLSNEMSETIGSSTADGAMLPSHASCHEALAPYAELMQWLLTSDSAIYTQLCRVYVESFSKVYEKQLTHFFEEVHKVASARQDRDRRGKAIGSSQDLTAKGSLRSKAAFLGLDRDVSGSELDLSERQRFDKLLEKMLCELEPACLAEQQFCVKFFHLVASEPGHQIPQHAAATIGFPGALVKSPSEELLLTSQKKVKQMNEELRKMMGKLFSVLEPELNEFIAYYDKVDSFYCMYLLVRLSQHVMSAQDTGSFVSMTFANCLVQVKRNFDKYMETQVRSMEETKISKKSKCGILPFILNFEEFAQQAGAIFWSSERRNYLDKWYVKLVSAMIDAIPKIAKEQNKTPKEVVMMENFHHLYALLSQLKIACLDGLRREVKQKYNDHLQAYVTEYFGRPLEKLNTFFEGVQAKVAQGVKEEEVGYQLAFSKQELRKVIKEYPSKEVKKGLESLYRKVEKHLCEEENLLQVVWHSMQEEFIRQYKYIESLIARCYPASLITLEFSINDILQFFSDIARSH